MTCRAIRDGGDARSFHLESLCNLVKLIITQRISPENKRDCPGTGGIPKLSREWINRSSQCPAPVQRSGDV